MRGAAVSEEWDVAIVGAGPAGLSAAASAARAGAKTIVLERAVHPRYKTCGGGLIGTSLKALGLDLPLSGQALPVREQVDAATFTLRGKHMFTRQRDDVLSFLVAPVELLLHGDALLPVEDPFAQRERALHVALPVRPADRDLAGVHRRATSRSRRSSPSAIRASGDAWRAGRAARSAGT